MANLSLASYVLLALQSFGMAADCGMAPPRACLPLRLTWLARSCHKSTKITFNKGRFLKNSSGTALIKNKLCNAISPLQYSGLKQWIHDPFFVWKCRCASRKRSKLTFDILCENARAPDTLLSYEFTITSPKHEIFYS